MDAHLVLLLLEAGNLVEVQISDWPFAFRDVFVGNLQVDELVPTEVNPPFVGTIDVLRVLDADWHTADDMIELEYVLVFYHKYFQF